VARIVQGLATGAAVGALGAGLLDLNKTRGTIADGVGALSGTATGALLSSLLVQYLPSPAHLVYLVLLAIFVLQGIGVVLMAETSPPRAGALASLRPQLTLPASARRPLLVAVPVLIAVWALGGFYGSLGPSLVRLVVGSNSVVFGGLALTLLAGAAALTVLLARDAPPRTVMILGSLALAVGGAVTLVALTLSSPVVFFVGAAVAGVGFGGGFQGALRTVLPLAAPHQRAGVLSIIYVVSYLGPGVPAVIGGFLAVHVGLLTAGRDYGVVVIALAALALLGTAGRHKGRPVMAAPYVSLFDVGGRRWPSRPLITAGSKTAYASSPSTSVGRRVSMRRTRARRGWNIERLGKGSAPTAANTSPVPKRAGSRTPTASSCAPDDPLSDSI